MAKLPIGSRRVTAALDNTGNNVGKWTAVFDPAVIASHWTMYEVYKMVVNIASTAGVVSFTVFIGQHQYEAYQCSATASWSDVQPMIVDSGESVYFYFSELSVDNTPPTVTMWLQVDLDIAKRA